jgi:hypothetical protein
MSLAYRSTPEVSEPGTENRRPGRDGWLARRVLRMEFRRSPALVLIGLSVLICLGQLWSEAVTANGSDGGGMWSSSWSAAGGWFSEMTVALGPLAGVAAAWMGGRERRRDAQELLTSTSRPQQQRLLMTWTASVVAVLGGFVIVAVVLAAAVFPEGRSYTGGRWAVTWLLVLLGLLACSAIGFAAGRLLPVRLAAPLVGIGLYFWGAVAVFSGWYGHLAPIGQLESEEGNRLTGRFILPLVVWLLTLTALALILATTRNGRLAAIVVLIATVAAIGLKDEGQGGFDRIWFERDPAAMAQVCTPDEPRVCVLGLHADSLATVTPVAREAIRAAAKYYPITRAVEADKFRGNVATPPDTVPLYLGDNAVPFRRSEIDLDDIRRSPRWLVDPACPGSEVYDSGKASLIAVGVAAWIVSGASTVEGSRYENDDPAAVSALHQQVAGTAQQEATWMTRYLAAARHCDIAALTRLARK